MIFKHPDRLQGNREATLGAALFVGAPVFPSLVECIETGYDLLAGGPGYESGQAYRFEEVTRMALKIMSDAFGDGMPIPKKYTCEGEDISPPLSWDSLPAGTKSLALVMDDPDAPDPAAPRMTWVHWVLYNLPPAVNGLAEGAGASDLPAGTCEGMNDWKRTGYGGPCPPIGRHRYFFKLYALNAVLPDLGAVGKLAVEKAMKPHVLEKCEMVGTYQKSRS